MGTAFIVAAAAFTVLGVVFAGYTAFSSIASAGEAESAACTDWEDVDY